MGDVMRFHVVMAFPSRIRIAADPLDRSNYLPSSNFTIALPIASPMFM